MAVTLVSLTGLVAVPFVLLRPQADSYTLRSYETAVVQEGALIEYVRGAGRLAPGSERSLLAPGRGTLSEWLVAEGEPVEAGQLLGRLDSPQLEQAVEDAEREREGALRRVEELRLAAEVAERAEVAQLTELNAALASAHNEFGLMTAVHEVGAASAHDLSAAQAAVTRAEARLAGAGADRRAASRTRELGVANATAALEQVDSRLALAHRQVEDLEVRSPISGQLLRRGVEVGAAVEAGAALATIAGTSDPRVEATLPEAQARSVGVGQSATIRVAGHDHPGVVLLVAPRTETGTDGVAAVPITLAFDSPPAGLRVGASATIEIEVGRKEDALYLPRGPYLTSGGERLAYVVDGGSARRQTVVFGLADGNRVEVRSGLAAGQRVVVSSYEAFKDHEEIQVAPGGDLGDRTPLTPAAQEEL